MKRLVLAFVLISSPAFARGGHDALMLRQPDGSYEGVNPGGSGPYSVQEQDGQSWAPVYDNRGHRVGDVQDDGSGTYHFYNPKGSRR